MKLKCKPPTVQLRALLLQPVRQISFLVLMGTSAYAQPASSSQPPTPGTNKPQQSTEQSSLVEGLLDLLEGPESSKENSKSSTQPLPKQPEVRRNLGSSNPLLSVRDRMKAAADLLQQGRSDQQTVEVQSSIVSQLDELIEQLQQQQKTSQQSSNQQMKLMQQQQMLQSQSQQSSSSKENEGSATKPNQANDAGSEADNTPGDRGTSTDANLRRNDPAALQQSVWGHLPDRVRSQMQSRMVEEFLPSYRQHIEAYYRALLEEGGKK